MPVLVVAVVLAIVFAVDALLALLLEFVWDSISPEFYPDMSFWVAFALVFVLSSLFKPRITTSSSK